MYCRGKLFGHCDYTHYWGKCFNISNSQTIPNTIVIVAQGIISEHSLKMFHDYMLNQAWPKYKILHLLQINVTGYEPILVECLGPFLHIHRMLHSLKWFLQILTVSLLWYKFTFSDSLFNIFTHSNYKSYFLIMYIHIIIGVYNTLHTQGYGIRQVMLEILATYPTNCCNKNDLLTFSLLRLSLGGVS